MDDTIIGLDVGFSRSRRTSGVARLAYGGLGVGCATSEWSDRQRVLSAFHDAAVSAIDAPLVGSEFSGPRLVERLLSRGQFQKRCKPGASHVPGTGQQLRAAGSDAAKQLSAITSGKQCRTDFPRVLEDVNIVEAFPNAFLGVCLGDDDYGSMPVLRRGEKFDWLYDRWRLGGLFDQLAREVGLADTEVPAACGTTAHHDERGALVCLLTAGAVYAGRYVAIGDRQGGYIFLPPWNLWATWARRDVDLRRREFQDLDVWIDGVSYSAIGELPPAL